MTVSADSPRPISLGIVGVGKIARDRHVPALASCPEFKLTATASTVGSLEHVPSFPDIGSMLQATAELEAVSLCLPPAGRAEVARTALLAGLHVMLEKPPGTTVSEVIALTSLAASKGLTLFAAWHSRAASAVEFARNWLASRRITAVRVDWREDVRVWHPGQHWIWQAGGFGVFDPGINALSILTHILPSPLVVRKARLAIPENCETPIRVDWSLSLDGHDNVHACFDFDHRGPARWDIEVDTPAGGLKLEDGGDRLSIDGKAIAVPEVQEYERLYAQFAQLIEAGQSDVDLVPLQLVADAFLLGDRVRVAPFEA